MKLVHFLKPHWCSQFEFRLQLYLLSCFLSDEVCVAMQYLMWSWFLCCRFYQQTPVSSHSSWCLVHHCSTGEKLLLLIHNLTMADQVLISNFLIILTGMLRIEETGPWDCLNTWLGPRGGGKINQDPRVIHSYYIITVSCLGAWNRGVSTSVGDNLGCINNSQI